MTEHAGVDLDLLADYIGGALDGTPDAERVARLVAEDPAWQQAFESLAYGMTAVGTQLRGLPPAGPMPDDVADRITTALAALPALDDAELARLDRLAAEPSSPAAELSSPAAELSSPAAGPSSKDAPAEKPRHLHAVPGTAAGMSAAGAASTGTGAGGRRRLRRLAGPIAVAAGVLAFAGFAANWAGGSAEDAASTTAHSAERAAESADPGSAAAGPMAGDAAGDVVVPAADRIFASERDFDATTLAAPDAPPAKGRTGTGTLAVPAPAAGDVVPSTLVARELARLIGREALQACLDAINKAHGTGTIGVQSVDYARYRGAPALVVRFTAADGTWAFASGPDCGAPGAGADQLDQVRVG